MTYSNSGREMDFDFLKFEVLIIRIFLLSCNDSRMMEWTVKLKIMNYQTRHSGFCDSQQKTGIPQ
ncbi:MAG: hypothetical protein DWQ10_05245 [Calditrichaeota bacterium]|nr:MAG: hypothetical protein DWQ10_05245 [Calditrichota bacterium]